MIIITVVTCLITIISFGQEEFVYNENGLNPKYLVVDIGDKDKSEIFNETINWIKETYKNPDDVIKTTIDNKKVRFEGMHSTKNICVKIFGKTTCYYALYTIEIEFKDGKYKFQPLSLKYRVPISKYNTSGVNPINLSDGSGYYNRKGELRKSYDTQPSAVEDLFNSLNSDLKIYLTTEKESNW